MHKTVIMKHLDDSKELMLSVLREGDILLLVPPFARTYKAPILDPHILQTLATQRGFKADILYLNVLLASIIGPERYDNIANAPRFWMLGERLFARSAYGLSPLGKNAQNCTDEGISISGNRRQHVKTSFEIEDFVLDIYLQLEKLCYSFVDVVVPIITSFHYQIIWSTIGWEQTNCAVAIFNKIKKNHPNIITLTGGMNCEGEMAEGIASLSKAIDYVFSGEMELAFNDFLDNYSTEKLSTQRIFFGKPLQDLDCLSLPDYEDFFTQIDLFLGDKVPKRYITYETSRGCWRGQKHQCTFCSLNSQERLQYRYKKPEKVLVELQQICHRYPNSTMLMTDHIMPLSYHKDLLPILRTHEEVSAIRYEIQPELELKDLYRLKEAKIDHIQPGIEALSTDLLNVINKRTTARQNLLLLRNALSMEMYVYWYLLWGFPGDKTVSYEETLKLLPLIRHLQPPAVLAHVRIERFSAYVQAPQHYNISNLRPWAVYRMVYPDWVDVDKLAYRFVGDYPSESHEHPELIEALAKEIRYWKNTWKQSSLVMYPVTDYYMIYDSRGIAGKHQNYMVDYRQAKQIMRPGIFKESDEYSWAVEKKFGTVIDSWYVPLVTASPELLLEFENEPY